MSFITTYTKKYFDPLNVDESLLDKNRKLNPKDKKTDWFYQNEEFDRKLDDRADKNNYRTM